MGLSARGAQRHGAGNKRRETRDRRRSSFIYPREPPGHAADDPRPTQPTLPHKAVRGARVRSSQLHLHIARRRRECRPGRRRHQWHSAAPLRRRGGRRRCSARCSPAGRRPPALQRKRGITHWASSPGERRPLTRMETGGLHAYLCSDSSQLHPSLRDSSAVPRRPSEAMPLSLAGNGVRWMPPINGDA